MKEYRINSASISVRDPNAKIDDLVDLVAGGVVYTPCLYVLNKVDAITIEELDLLDKGAIQNLKKMKNVVNCNCVTKIVVIIVKINFISSFLF